MSKTMVITGASTGIGRACALHFDKKGYRVFAGVRKEADAESLKSEASDRLTPLMLDVTDGESVERAARTVKEAVGEAGLDGLINNAGLSAVGPTEVFPVDRFRDIFEVNLFGLLAVTQAFLPLLRKANGRIINMSSQGGRFAIPLIGAYCASKHALEAMSDSLRVELLPSGVKVILIEPSSIKTPIWEKTKTGAQNLVDSIPEDKRGLYEKELATILSSVKTYERMAIPPERVVKAVERAFTANRPKLRYLVGLESYLLIYMVGSLPRKLVDRIFARRIRNSG